MTPKEEKEQIKEQVKEQFLRHIGSVIRIQRNKNRIDRHTLASAIGVDDSTLSRYELGISDIKASVMAYISVLCNFPMCKYTEIYDKKPAAIVDDFKKLVQISAPVKRRKPAKHDDRPPKPKLVFDNQQRKWVMHEAMVKLSQKYEIDSVLTHLNDSLMIEHITCNDRKLQLLSHISDLVEYETMGGNQKCSPELRSVVRATVKYLASDPNKSVQNRLMMYVKALTSSFTQKERP